MTRRLLTLVSLVSLGFLFAVGGCGDKKKKKKDPEAREREQMKEICDALQKHISSCPKSMHQVVSKVLATQGILDLKQEPVWKKLSDKEKKTAKASITKAMEDYTDRVKRNMGIGLKFVKKCKKLAEMKDKPKPVRRLLARYKTCVENSLCSAFWKCFAPPLYQEKLVPKPVEKASSDLTKYTGKFDTSTYRYSARKCNKPGRPKKKAGPQWFYTDRTGDVTVYEIKFSKCGGKGGACGMWQSLIIGEGALTSKGDQRVTVSYSSKKCSFFKTATKLSKTSKGIKIDVRRYLGKAAGKDEDECKLILKKQADDIKYKCAGYWVLAGKKR